MQRSRDPQDVTETHDRDHIRSLVQYCGVLPTIPGTIEPVLTLVDNLDASLDGLEAAITRDLSCTVQLLRTANSALYSPAGTVTSIRRAILLLGCNLIKRIATNLPIFDSFLKRHPEEMSTITNLWLHSHRVATLSKRIAHDIPYVETELAFCAGLLQDIGRVVMLHLFSKDYHLCLARTEPDPAYDLLQAERHRFGVTHVQTGRWFAEACHLPPLVLNAITNRYHPHPGHPLIMTIALADYLVKTHSTGSTVGHHPRIELSRFVRTLNLTPKHLERYVIYLQSQSDPQPCPMAASA